MKKKWKIKCIAIVLLISGFISCTNNNDNGIVLINLSKDIQIEFPDSLEILFNGYKVGVATLTSEYGEYFAKFKEEIQLTESSDFTFVNDNLLGYSSCYFELSDVAKGRSNNSTEIDTFHYRIEVKDDIIENEVLNLFKEFADTLISEKQKQESSISENP